ncbi:hypothetical protein [Rhizobium leguminosarum]|uniref:hypothetical protein n=1 Tax=Rhizobium leguminosarum TaxID=384 RepID=UPI0015F80999|nr:hypothetical protein [Rhizobium leguminosarum]MBA9035951.1 hypothetical protein [Rhizobium leguminosarum]
MRSIVPTACGGISLGRSALAKGSGAASKKESSAGSTLEAKLMNTENRQDVYERVTTRIIAAPRFLQSIQAWGTNTMVFAYHRYFWNDLRRKADVICIRATGLPFAAFR